MSPRYKRHTDGSDNIETTPGGIGSEPDEEAMEDAAEALRQAEVEAVQPEVSTVDVAELESMSIDDLRVLAKELDVPDRGKIIEQDELIAAIRQRL